jgi:DNA topoisomerase-2
LGLESGKEYKSIEDVYTKLRYGKIMILTDSDVDGSHIKGLVVNLFHSEYASLFRISGFISFMNTPILRAIKGQQKLLFYNEGEYNTWKDGLVNGSVSGWVIKYFKGLGTSSSAEFKEYFLNNRVVDFVYTDKTTDDVIDKIFNKKRPDERKLWLQHYDKSSYLNTSTPTVKYEDFIDKELKHFSIYDCERSLPNLVDGLKTSQRKILYCAFKRNLTKEIKIAQFSGYISENANYHHGEVSLQSTTIALAQDFVGSNNINIFEPKGTFGSRLHGGSDNASPRYIFTNLSPITRFIFKENDDHILNYLSDDGTSIEPDFYIPIIPFVLCNSQLGIGTGFSTSIPSFNPKQIIEYLKNKLNNIPNQEQDQWKPYYENFKGIVTAIANEPQKFLIKGIYTNVDDSTIIINELPIGNWTMLYVAFLETLVEGSVDKNGKKIAPILKDFVSNSTEKVVDIKVTFSTNIIKDLESQVDCMGINGIEKLLKLTTTVATSNMHLFDKDSRLLKYNNVTDIIDAYYDVRLKAYQTRKENLIKHHEQLLLKISMKAKYIMLVLDDTIDLRRKTSVQIDELLTKMALVKIEGTFDYLIKMAMNSVSNENVNKLLKEKGDIQTELSLLKNTSIQQTWIKELNELDVEYTKYKSKRNTEYITSSVVVEKKKAVIKKRKIESV